ncbi:hypothetical protein [Bartonella florencae]|uniref:hypothetical protein n=1 Tax=Bartonella florencae TaxID=928210 RepID=UPI00055C7BFD|nr:hypothetical protein [Bartonella florencae]
MMNFVLPMKVHFIVYSFIGKSIFRKVKFRGAGIFHDNFTPADLFGVVDNKKDFLLNFQKIK